MTNKFKKIRNILIGFAFICINFLMLAMIVFFLFEFASSIVQDRKMQLVIIFMISLFASVCFVGSAKEKEVISENIAATIYLLLFIIWIIVAIMVIFAPPEYYCGI
jgi:hypothetical protein